MDINVEISYDELEEWLQDDDCPALAAEIDGVMSGLLSAGAPPTIEFSLRMLMAHAEVDAWSEGTQKCLSVLFQQRQRALASSEFEFELFLPDEYSTLQSKTKALAAWCQGFLVGFGTAVKAGESDYSEDVQTALRDIVEISRLDESEVDTEENQQAFEQVQDYVRMAALMVHTDLALKEQAGKKKQGDKKPLH